MSDKSGKLEALINKVWYGKSYAFVILLPLTLVFSMVAALRRALYRRGLLRSQKIPVAVIVVGNIAVGGAGKTPITLWLAETLKASGRSPAIISRGHGGREISNTVRVTAESDPALVGDEPVLLARRSGCAVFVDRNRVRAALNAVHAGADVIISDDGLQHYRLKRDVEIAVVDGARGFGNGFLLPAGPLREPVSRLDAVDRILIQAGSGDIQVDSPNHKSSRFRLTGDSLRRVSDDRVCALSELSGKSVHAVAGIAHPARFFAYLESSGMKVIRHPLPDHAEIRQSDLTFDDDLEIVMTEKDAVKCLSWLDTSRCWYVSVDIHFRDSAGEALLSALLKKISRRKYNR